MKQGETILDQILVDVRRDLAEAQRERPLSDLRRRIQDAPPLRSFPQALESGFGLIAEIKERSPSHGPMRAANVADAAAAYEQSSMVRGLSVLTNATHFGMSVERLLQVKLATTKPILRKDFIFDEYQVYEARAYGADGILLMANLLDAPEMAQLYTVAQELGMEALFECHSREQIQEVPSKGRIYGINSRTFASRKNTLGVGRYGLSSLLGRLGSRTDLTIDEGRFELGQFLPGTALKVAESGVHPDTVAGLRDRLGYHAALVGTSLLTAADGVHAELQRFEAALAVRSANAPAGRTLGAAEPDLP